MVDALFQEHSLFTGKAEFLRSFPDKAARPSSAQLLGNDAQKLLHKSFAVTLAAKRKKDQHAANFTGPHPIPRNDPQISDQFIILPSGVEDIFLRFDQTVSMLDRHLMFSGGFFA